MHYKHYIEPIIKEAGHLLLSFFGDQQKLIITRKQDGSFQTNADIAVESFLKQKLQTIIPDAAFLAEESGLQVGSDYCFVIDPLDGTSNFIAGIPHFCISVALEHKGMVIAGAIYQPILDELFYAEAGKGAFFSKNAYGGVKKADQKGDPFMFVATSAQMLQNLEHKNTNVIDENNDQWGIKYRICGSLALDLAYVASQRFNVALFANFNYWDVAAGLLLIQESGMLILTQANLRNKAFNQKIEQFLIAGDEKYVLKLLKNLNKDLK